MPCLYNLCVISSQKCDIQMASTYSSIQEECHAYIAYVLFPARNVTTCFQNIATKYILYQENCHQENHPSRSLRRSHLLEKIQKRFSQSLPGGLKRLGLLVSAVTILFSKNTNKIERLETQF